MVRRNMRAEHITEDELRAKLREHGIDARLLQMLDAGSLRLKLLAATALGYLREKRAWDALATLAREPLPVLSFTAAQALIRIEPAEAIDLLAGDLVSREDWSLARLGGLFRELGPDVVTAPLARIIDSKPRHGADRVVKLKPDFAEGHYNRGLVLEARGQLEQAESIQSRRRIS